MTSGTRRPHLRLWRALAVLIIACPIGPGPLASEAYREEAVKAAFLHRFTGFVDWPASALDGGAFRIAVLGAPDVLKELEDLLANRQIKGLPVVVTSAVPKSGVRPQLLYVGRGFRGDLGRLLTEQRDRPVLLVTDQPRGLEEGAAINFLVVDQRVRFEVAPTPAQNAGMHISSQLLAVAVRVLGGRGESAR